MPAGLPPVATSRPLGGGDVGQVWQAVLEDGRQVVVKRGPGAAELEAEGLGALAAAGAPTPAVLGVDADVLVLEHVGADRHGAGDPAELGRRLAGVHRTTRERFGWHRDNLIGPLPQANAWTPRWSTFLAERRLAPHLSALPAELAGRIQAAIDDGRLAVLAEHDQPPSLVHGDLWPGNVLHDRWLIDPAVHYADREVDLAMLELFGTIPRAMARGYDEMWPLAAGWQGRRPLLQLPPLLVHVRLFGAGYLGGVASRLDALGW